MLGVRIAAGLTAALIFAAGAAAAQTPVIHAGERCASCGMEILRYPGPKGVIVMKDGTQKAFCSARALACELAKAGDVKGAYVHDAGKTGWTQPDDAAMIDARSAWYVYGSKMKAVMGPSLAPFADKAAAEKFQAENGGKLLSPKELTAQVLGCRAHN